MTPYLRSLRDAGHEIVVLQTGPEDKPRSYGANTSVVVFQVPQDDGLLEMIPQIIWKQTSHATEPPIIMSLGDLALGQFVDQYSDKISDLLNQHWDLVVIDALFCPHGYAVATFLNRHRGVPFVVYSTSWVIPSSAASMSLGRNWPSSLSMFLPIQQDTRDVYKPKLFSNRLVTTLENGIDLFAHHVLAPGYLLTNLPRFGVERFTMNELHRRSSLFFSDGFHGFEMPQAEAFNVRFTGAYCSHPKPLTDELKAFVEDPTSKGQSCLENLPCAI
ncbi:CBN-UGT-63 protein [Aphelenchoides avenae]|nr:CBN-UGT-63 protein [Aphelenchus avenae]